MRKITEALKTELDQVPAGRLSPELLRMRGYAAHEKDTPYRRRAYGLAALFTSYEPFIYQNDLIVGSIRPLYMVSNESEAAEAKKWMEIHKERNFHTNADHFAADYMTAARIGIPGLLEHIDRSAANGQHSEDELDYLSSMKITLLAFRELLLSYARKAGELIGTEGYDTERLRMIQDNCTAIAWNAPQTFAQGLQLVWLIHTCFVSEGKGAMALGRIDQFLYSLYESDIACGRLTDDGAQELLANVFAKIGESKYRDGTYDVINICIGGTTPDGKCAINPLSYCVLHAVDEVHLPGQNLSARVPEDAPDEFLDECLKVIGTGLGYPALMNDSVNMAALRRYGYEEEDVRDYCMVGCIENFITGKQPAWSDGRFDPIMFLEDVLCKTPTEELDAIPSMDAFMERYKERLAWGVDKYTEWFSRASAVADPKMCTSPFMSCFCDCCIERGKDINMGGAKYPSTHGAVLMGIGTVSDSLAAIEQVVFTDHKAKLSDITAAINANFEGFETLHELVKAAPKYGNNNDFVDKYAVWYTGYLADLFDRKRTYDGGPYYIAMAANVTNIYAGKDLKATPDGRLAGQPLSDAASPTYGKDERGVTATLLSVSKPDYTRCACGTVVNQKFSPSVFQDGKRQKLRQLIRIYFSRGGQEIQINSTSREVLMDASAHPEKYPTLVVRVSGFSALYVILPKEVQNDILSRTQHEAV
ncbi:MAG: hypothetical protein IJR83_04085 [Clostridia bacterium]|nr:hypothetical protein [Clostridia bacterium]